MQAYTRSARWLVSRLRPLFRRKTCNELLTGLFPPQFGFWKRERYQMYFMRVTRLWPKLTSTGFSRGRSAADAGSLRLRLLLADDVAALQTSARLIEGEHDFLSFAATDPDLTTRNREPDPKLDLEMKRPLCL